jgi:hypothetical protein
LQLNKEGEALIGNLAVLDQKLSVEVHLLWHAVQAGIHLPICRNISRVRAIRLRSRTYSGPPRTIAHPKEEFTWSCFVGTPLINHLDTSIRCPSRNLETAASIHRAGQQVTFAQGKNLPLLYYLPLLY